MLRLSRVWLVNSGEPCEILNLKCFFSQWEFKAKYHATGSDIESLPMSQLLEMASPDDKKNFDELWLGYTQTWGAPELREQIAKTYDTLKASNILCMAGAGEGIYTLMRVLLKAGDHAIVITPNYQSAETIPLEICEVTGVPLHEDNDWRMDLDELADSIRPNTRLIAINFPHNPTGTVMPPEDIKALIALCRKHDLHLFSDEVFRLVELNDEDRMPQIADIYEKGISLNVMSKAYGLPGLRIGWLASQDLEFLQSCESYKHYLSICNSGPSEQLALIALKNSEQILDRNRKILRRNIQELDRLLNDYPSLFQWNKPKGSCIGFPKYLGEDGVEDFCRSLLLDSGVLLLPSSIYRSELRETPTDNFRIGFGRIQNFDEGLSAIREHIETKYF